ncbi:MAG: hypothetical protein H6694_06915 [Candidatus Latescibacteria bacterium]|nr:hypothetical protein [Candidatus Latescibacterota bacterium]
MKKAVVIVTLALILGACGSGAQDADYVATIDAWHAQREAALAAEDGWLSLVALLPIEQGARTLGSAPDAELRLPAPAPPRVGTITLNDAGGLGLEPAPGVPLRVGDDVLTARSPWSRTATASPPRSRSARCASMRSSAGARSSCA